MSERATIRDFEANEELDAELQKKCAEIFVVLDENKIDYEYEFCKYMPIIRVNGIRLYCEIRVLKLYSVAIHINVDKILYISGFEHVTKNIGKFHVEELVARCEIIRLLIDYCKVYLVNFSICKSIVFIENSKNDVALGIYIAEDYDNFSFVLSDNSEKYIISSKIEPIFKYICANFKELTKPRFLNTKSAKLY